GAAAPAGHFPLHGSSPAQRHATRDPPPTVPAPKASAPMASSLPATRALDVAAGNRVVFPHDGAIFTGARETATGVDVHEIVVRRGYFRIGVEVDAGLGALAAGDVEVGQAERIGFFALGVHDLHAVLGEAGKGGALQHQTGNVKLNRDER